MKNLSMKLAEQLVIFFYQHQRFASWVLLDGKGELKSYVKEGDLTTFTPPVNCKIYLIVPAEDVLLTTVPLPKMNPSRLRQALPFALEDSLVSDIEQLHFAIGAERFQNETPVAIVNKEKMTLWQTYLAQFNLNAHAFVANSLTTQCAEQIWHIEIAEIAHVRINSFKCFSCDISNLLTALTAALKETVDLPTKIVITNLTASSVSQDWNLPITIDEQFVAEDHYYVQKAKLAVTAPINLLQSKYAVKSNRLDHGVKFKRWSVYIGTILVALLWIGPIVSYAILKQRLSQLNNQIATIYYQHFPQAKTVVAPKLRFQEKLKKLSGQSKENDLFMMLGAIGKEMSENNRIKIKKLDFQNHQLTLDVIANSSEDFSTFTNYLQQQGLRISQQNTHLEGTNVNAMVIIG